MKTQMAVRH